MLRLKNILVLTTILAALCSCEEVIKIDLNTADPAFVVEAIIYKDSVCSVRLTWTTNYFSLEEPDFIEDAKIMLSDGVSIEELIYKGNGYYFGDTILGTEEQTYRIEINHDGILYEGFSVMPQKADIISVSFTRSESPSVYNPDGETVFTIGCEFNDNPDEDNYYMIYYTEEGELIEERYFMLTENVANGGTLSKTGNIINFSESIFYEGGEVEVQLFSINKSTYKFFMQLDDVLFWKRRVMPPIPYNPVSNISNGALGYFAAWAYDSRTILLE